MWRKCVENILMKPPIIMNVHRVLVKKLCSFLLLSASLAGPEVSGFVGSTGFTSTFRCIGTFSLERSPSFADACKGCIDGMGGKSYAVSFCLVGSVMGGAGVSLVFGFGNEGAGVSNSDCDDNSCAGGVDCPRLACLAAVFSRNLLSSRASFCAFLIADLDGFEGRSDCLSKYKRAEQMER